MGHIESPREKAYLEDLGADWRMILIWKLKKLNGCVNWIELT
jgi:hypothetical protein